MIRFSTPLYDESSDFQGVIVLNYLGNTFLDDFKELAKGSEGAFALLNEDGYWLSCKNEDNEWGFMYEDKQDTKFSNVFPDEWKRIIREEGQFVSEHGLFTFAPVPLNQSFVKDSLNPNEDKVNHSDSKWYIVSFIDTDNPLAPYFLENKVLTIKDVFKENNYQLFIVAIISLLVGSLVYLNRKKYSEIKFFSEYDPLTKAFNRRAGYKKIQDLIYKNDKRDTLFSLCFIDVNGLKQVNDHLGHEHGDELLVTVCDIIRYNIRESDFLIRQGGDEFIIAFSDIGVEKAEIIWQRIMAEFEEINRTSGHQYIFSVSHGIVEYNNQNKMDIATLIQVADDRMYQEKEVMKMNFSVLKGSRGKK